MQPNSKPLLLNSRTGLGSARKTLAPIEPEAIKNRELALGIVSPTPDLITEAETKAQTMSSLKGCSSLQEKLAPRKKSQARIRALPQIDHSAKLEKLNTFMSEDP